MGLASYRVTKPAQTRPQQGGRTYRLKSQSRRRSRAGSGSRFYLPHAPTAPPCRFYSACGRVTRVVTHEPTLPRLIVDYAQVSTHEQDLILQGEELVVTGCTHIYSEQISAGRHLGGFALEGMLDSLRPNDVVDASRLDWLA